MQESLTANLKIPKLEAHVLTRALVCVDAPGSIICPSIEARTFETRTWAAFRSLRLQGLGVREAVPQPQTPTLMYWAANLKPECLHIIKDLWYRCRHKGI